MRRVGTGGPLSGVSAGAPIDGPPGADVTVISSKWFGSERGRNSPPHFPPSDFQRVPRKAHTSTGVVLAGVSPTRRSTAREGHRVCSDAGASGLISIWCAAVRAPEMTKTPGQRSPSAAKIALARFSKATTRRARPAAIDHRRDRPQTSSVTRSERTVLP